MPAYTTVIRIPMCIKHACGKQATHMVHDANHNPIAAFCLEHAAIAVRKLNDPYGEGLLRRTTTIIQEDHAEELDHPDHRAGGPGPGGGPDPARVE